MYFAIFNGMSRGIGSEPTKEVYLKVGVGFRTYLHHFKGAKLAIFMAICLHMDEAGRSFPSYDTLMELTGLNRATVAKAVKELQATSIEGKSIIGVHRERDKRGRLVGNNHYTLFPTPSELQSLENPTLEKPNYQKTILEEEPVVKEKPKRKDKGVSAASAAPPSPSHPSNPVASAPSLPPSQPTPQPPTDPMPTTTTAKRRKTQPPDSAAPPSHANHPLIAAYRLTFQRYPSKAQMAQLAQMEATPLEEGRFVAACQAWLMAGYNPSNLRGILDWYKDGVPDYRPANPNAHTKPVPKPKPSPSPYANMTEEEKAAYLEACEPIEDDEYDHD